MRPSPQLRPPCRGVALVLKRGVQETRADFQACRRSGLQAPIRFVQKDGEEVVKGGKEETEVEDGAVEKAKKENENVKVASAAGGKEGNAVRRGVDC